MEAIPDLAGAVPLLLTNDPSLESEVRRLAAAAGVGVERQGDVLAIGRAWSRAPLVLVGADTTSALSATRPGRRADVHVLAADGAAPTLFRDALAVGAETVTELPDGNSWLVELLTDSGEVTTRSATVLGFIGASGGSGTSTMAAATALALARECACLLVDGDPLGGGVDQIAGLQELTGVRWGGIGATGRLGGRALRESLPASGSLAVLGFDPGPARLPAPEVVRETLSAARRGFDVVVIDLGRHPDPALETALERCDHVFMVTTLTLSALSAASRLRPRLPTGASALIARGVAHGVDASVAAATLGIPLALVMDDQSGLDEAVVLGTGPTQRRRGPLARAVRTLLDGLAGDLP